MASISAGIVSLFAVIVLSLLIMRVGAVALSLTGVAEDMARFQARSAFLGVGFTTREAEHVVNHPVRRRILEILMLMGGVGIVTAVATLIIGFSDTPDTRSGAVRAGILFGGILLLWLLSRSKVLTKLLTRWIEGVLRRVTRLDVRDYQSLLRLQGDYAISELSIEPGDWIAERRLRETRLRDEGLMVIGVRRKDGRYVGVPNGDTTMHSGDVLLVYGREEAVAGLDLRSIGPQGERQHEEAVRAASLERYWEERQQT